jgi:hypothetical protein
MVQSIHCKKGCKFSSNSIQNMRDILVKKSAKFLNTVALWISNDLLLFSPNFNYRRQSSWFSSTRNFSRFMIILSGGLQALKVDAMRAAWLEQKKWDFCWNNNSQFMRQHDSTLHRNFQIKSFEFFHFKTGVPN